jgi:hypothetical protein
MGMGFAREGTKGIVVVNRQITWRSRRSGLKRSGAMERSDGKIMT